MESLLPLLARFPKLRELNLSENKIRTLPADLTALSRLQSINLNGNLLSDVFAVVDALATIPGLKHLSINLNSEEQVDHIMKQLTELELLNGLSVDRDDEGEEEEEEEEEDA